MFAEQYAGNLFASAQSNPNTPYTVGLRVRLVHKEYMQQFEKALKNRMNAITTADVRTRIQSPAWQQHFF